MRPWLYLLLCTLFACESSDEPRFGSIEGQVVRAEDRIGYGPVAIALYELKELRIVATAQSDESGSFLFERLSEGDYTPVVYDEERVVFQLERPYYRVRAGEVASANIPMAALDAYADTGIFLEGTVRDAADGAPIAGAVVGIVEISDLGAAEVFSELRGRSGPMVGVTSDVGFYRIGPLPIFVFESEDGPRQRIPEVRAFHPLYEGAWAGPWDRVSAPQVQDFQLTQGPDTGVVTGSLLDISTLQVAPGLSIAIEWQGASNTFPKLLLTQRTAISDSLGRFTLRHLPAGRFTLQAAYLPDDGFVGAGGRTALLDAAGDSVHLAQPIYVAPGLVLLAPQDGASPDGLTRFDWSDVNGALAYSFEIVREDLAFIRIQELVASEFVVDAGLAEFLAGGSLFRWGALAHGTAGLISFNERPNTLRR